MSRIIVMTGATSGIGAIAAARFAANDARIVFIARDKQRAAMTLKQLRQLNPDAQHAVHMADLSSIAEMKRAAVEIAAAEPVIDVLVNNAGAVFMGSHKTIDGLAPSFATNHLAYHVLTLMLLPRLRAASQPRIVCTSSRAHRYGRIDFDHLQRDGIAGYAQSKLANLLFVRKLAQLLKNEKVTVNALHPGFVATRFADNTNLLWRSLMQLRKRVHGLTPEEGAQTLIHLVESPDLATATGGYYVRCQLATPSSQALDDVAAERLWKTSVALTGIDFSVI